MNILIKTLVVCLVLAFGATAQAQNLVIGGATGNGDFNAGGGGTAGGAQAYDATANWFNAQGAETTNFTNSSQMGGSTDPDNATTTRGGMPFNDRTQVNNSGFTVVEAGQVFSLSYDFGAGGPVVNWDGDEEMRTFLFTASASVDGSLTVGDMTEIAASVDIYDIGRAGSVDPQWTTRTVATMYTTTAADIGKTIYFGMQFLDAAGATLFPRIDVVNLEVTGTTVVPDILVVGGATGNGDFNAGGGGTDGGAQPYDATVNWFNAEGPETTNFTNSSQMGASSDPDNATTTRGGMPFQNRTQVNDTGYTILEAGQVFSLSYDFGAGGGPAGWTGDEDMRTFLFTASAPVDGDLTVGDMTEIAASVDIYDVDRANDPQWTTRSVATMYTTTAADVGNTVYFGMQFLDPAGTTLFPRIDVVNLQVTGATGMQVVLGDANDDGSVNSFDIAAFGIALFDAAAYALAYPDVDPDVQLDMNGDDTFNSFDIPGFGAALGF